MRVLAFLLLCTLPSAAAAQTADGTLLPILNRLTAYERDLRALTDTVERLQRRIDGLELRIGELKRAAAEQSADTSGPPVEDTDGTATPAATTNETEASALPGGNALELYNEGRNLLLQERMPEAENVFKTFLKDFAEHELANNARHWLAASLAEQDRHSAAANQFLLAYEEAPDGPKAPDNLLKLAKALAAKGNPQDACTALSLLARKHKQAPPAVIAAAGAERRRLKC